MSRGRLPDPSWKSGPPDPKPSASEHAIEPMYEEPTGMDIDGVGRDEAERIDGEPLLAVRELYRCPRDGCDASLRRVHLYRVEDVDAISLPPDVDPVAFLASRATIVDHDGEHPYVGFKLEEHIVVDSVGPHETLTTDDAGGPCYGRVEPSPEPYGL